MQNQQNLTDKQHLVLRYIKQHIRELGYPPSIRDICLNVGVKSTSTVHNYLNCLESKGLIHRDHNITRAIEVRDQAAETISFVYPVPIVEHFQDGSPLLSPDDIEEYFPYPRTLIDTESSFFVRIKNSSMCDLGFTPGDLILIHIQSTADTGDIVFTHLNPDRNSDGNFYIYYDPDKKLEDNEIIGKVIGLIRMY